MASWPPRPRPWSSTLAVTCAPPTAAPGTRPPEVPAAGYAAGVWCPAGYAHCSPHGFTDTDLTPPSTTTWWSRRYSPAQLRTSYCLGTGSAPQRASVYAYANPNAAKDLDFYRSSFGIPASNLTQVSQTGGPISKVRGNTGWGQEEMLDLEMVSAICPACPILYVGAKSASFNDLAAAVDRAAIMGAKVISNSYGANEFSGEATIATHYNHPGVAITVSSGDSGYGAQAPAAFNTVTAVGGTTLTLNADGTRANETVWSGAGSGCSAYITKPTWQHDTACTRRTISDVAAVADPATGVAVYDSYGSTGGANRYEYGGPSVPAPHIGAADARPGRQRNAADRTPKPQCRTSRDSTGEDLREDRQSNGIQHRPADGLE